MSKVSSSVWQVTDKKGTPLEIRPLASSDQLALSHFFTSLSAASKSTFQPHPFTSDFAAKMCQDAESPHHLRMVATLPKKKGEIIAYAFVTRVPLLTAYGYFGIGVADEAQGRGISTLLMSALFNYAQLKKTRYIYLNVFADNERAINAYRKQGFTKISVPRLLSKLFTLYQLWYSGVFWETVSRPSPTSSTSDSHPSVWMTKKL